MTVKLSDWKRTRGSVITHLPTGIHFYLLQGDDLDETIIEVDRMAYKPTAPEVERLEQEALYAFERVDASEDTVCDELEAWFSTEGQKVGG